MEFIPLYWLFILPGVFAFRQTDYNLTFERMEVAGFNTHYLSSIKTHNFKYNRSQAVTNIMTNLKVAFENELKLEVQAYRFASNEYRLFPLRFMFDYCEFAGKDEFGLNKLWSCGNLSDCPWKKGFYNSCIWAPNGRRFPPFIPEGSYMLDLKYYYRSVEVIFLQLYGTIKYPFVGK